MQLSGRMMQGVGKIVAHRVESLLQGTANQLANDVTFAQTLPLNLTEDATRWQTIFWQQLQISNQVNSYYLADMQGNMVQAFRLPQWATRVITRQGDTAQEQLVYRQPNFSPLPVAHVVRPTTYDPRTRPWFQTSLNTPERNWSAAYRFESSKKIGVTLSQALQNAQGQTIGIFGVDLTLEGLADFLSQQVFGDYDIAMIINDENDIIAHPLRLKLKASETELLQSGRLPNLDMVSPAQTWVVQAAALSPPDDITEPMQLSHFDQAGTRYWALRYRFPPEVNARWTLLIIAPEADLLGGTQGALQENLTLVILSFALFGFILYLTFGKTFRVNQAQQP
jgi:hypothetical protein